MLRLQLDLLFGLELWTKTQRRQIDMLFLFLQPLTSKHNVLSSAEVNKEVKVVHFDERA